MAEPFLERKLWIDDTNGANIPHAWNPVAGWYPVPLNGGPMKTQLDAVQNTAASVEELGQSVFMPCWVSGASSSSSNNAPTMWTAPFPCRVVAATIVWDYFSQATSNTNYLAITLRRRTSADASTDIATKTTQTTGGEAITARKPWDFAGGPWADVLFNAGDSLAFAWSLTGTITLSFPLAFTFRYVPA